MDGRVCHLLWTTTPAKPEGPLRQVITLQLVTLPRRFLVCGTAPAMIGRCHEQVSPEISMRKVQLAAVIAAFAISAPAMAQGRGRGNGGVPPGQRPPAGMCRIWIDGVPPGHQPAPTDCATAAARVPPNARIIYGDQVSVNPRDPRRDVYDQSGRVYDPRRSDRNGQVVYDPRRVDPNGQVVYDPRRVDENGRVTTRSDRDDDRVRESRRDAKHRSAKHKHRGDHDDQGDHDRN
jgi:hypothetical protein